MMRRRAQSGQSMTEFALVFPVAAVIIFGLITASWLFFQSSALRDGASAGARMAAIETSLNQTSGGQQCESGSPISIETAVAQAAPQIKVNMSQLCVVSTTQLRQVSNNPNAANIVVDVTPGVSNPVTVKVTLTFSGQGIAPPLGAVYPISATSTVPVLT